MIELRTLGTLVLRDPKGEDIGSVLAQPKRVALLAYLAIARPRGFHRRDSLLALLWPEQDEQHARWALNQALRHLRNALGREVITSRGDAEVGVDPRLLSSDAVEFESAIKQSDSARALELYRGDLLDGFHVSGCREFEGWLEEERVWLRGQAARAAWTLAERHLAEDEPLAAGHWARRGFAFSPRDEGEARRLFELLDRIGDRAGAVEVYEEFATRLWEDYQVEPAPETRALIDAVRGRQDNSGAGNGRATVNRETETAVAVALPGVASATAVTPMPLSVPQGRKRPKVFLALGSLLLAGVVVIWAPEIPRSPRGGGDAAINTLAVFPFAYRGSSEFAYLGEGMVDLLSANLNGAGDIRTVEPQTVLALARRARGSTAEPGQAQRVAARLNAGSLVLGDVVEAGGRLRISGRLYNVPAQGQVPVSATVQGAPEQLFQLVDELTAQLIAGRSGEPSASLTRLAALTTDSLAALRAYLEGERHFRAGRGDSSVQALDRAILIDSAFALAHYRMATAAMWTERRPLAAEAANRALRLASRLSYRHRRLIGALSASLHGRIPDAERMYREIVSRYPDDLEANYQLGDLIFHRFDILGRSWLDAREQFERVLSIDPYHQSSLYHLSNIAARERTKAQLDSLTRRVLEIVPPPAWFFRAQRAIVFGDTAEVTRFVAAMREVSDNLAQPTMGFVVGTTGDLVVGRRLWRVLTEPSRSRGVRVLAHLTLAKIELMTGRWYAAEMALDSAGAIDVETALEHRVLLGLWPHLQIAPSKLLQLRQSVLEWKAVPEPATETTLTVEHAPAHPYLRLYLLGLLSARLGDHADALRRAAELTRLAPASFAPSFVSQLGRTVRAEVARSRGQLEESLSILDSLTLWTKEDLELGRDSPFYSHEYEVLMRAELLYAVGRYDEALRAFRQLADGLFHSGAPAHLRLAEIYERQGERQKAAAHYARFAELWKDCDPEFRPLVDLARSRMAFR